MKYLTITCSYLLSLAIALLFTCCIATNDNAVKDVDGHIYQTITIGKQVWMAENLQVTRYRNGEPVQHITDTAVWSACTTGAYCNYNNDTGHVAGNGRLYNWHAIHDSRTLAPEGWHIPTDEEIATLVTWLEKNPATADTLKVQGLAGYRHCNGGTYHTMGFNGYWWSANRSFEIYDWSPRVFTGFADVQRNRYEAGYGLAVRCVKD
jgi:uncharacterized protein (TIGR02145 family)